MKEQCHFERCTNGTVIVLTNITYTLQWKRIPNDQNNDSCLKVVKKFSFQGVQKQDRFQRWVYNYPLIWWCCLSHWSGLARLVDYGLPEIRSVSWCQSWHHHTSGKYWPYCLNVVCSENAHPKTHMENATKSIYVCHEK